MPETDKEVIRKGFEETTSGKEDKKDFGGDIKDRKDEEVPQMPAWADAMMKKLDALSGRMDAFDKKDRKDSDEDRRKEEDRKDKKDRKDESDREKGEKEERKAGEELEKGRKEEEKGEKEDKKDARLDSLSRENALLRDRLASVEMGVKSLSRELSPEDKDALAMAQTKADSVFRALNEPLTGPLAGESPVS